ncbi:MAG: 30S ribosomal protein S21 [Candidatus Yonathbacteria bacterium]|nr:30S ribosomal protein S21 [Candidatus Yonathbacteria bacterium]
MATTNVQVSKNNNENAAGLLRRFSRAVQSSGVVKRVKANRYLERPMSKYTRKSQALKRLAKRNEAERLKKLGKEPQR